MRLARGFRLDDAPPARPARAPLTRDPEPGARLVREALEQAQRCAEALSAAGAAGAAGADGWDQAMAWITRAYALAPNDQNVAAARASMLFSAGETAAAYQAFTALGLRHDLPALWLGAALAAERLGEVQQAAEAAARLIAGGVIWPQAQPILTRLARAAGYAGFCALDATLRVVSSLPTASLALLRDGGRPHDPARPLPASCGAVRVSAGDARLLGETLHPARVLRLEGIVRRQGRHVTGWAWHPGDPDRPPRLRLRDARAGIIGSFTCRDYAAQVSGHAALLAARRIELTLPPGTGEIAVIGPNGGMLTGAPLPARLLPRRIRPRPKPAPAGGVDVIIPVYRGVEETLACLQSVRDCLAPACRVIVVDDATPEPALAEVLAALNRSGAITLIGSDGRPGPGRVNRGFIAAANAGMAHAGPGRDVVLLNSDTLVTPGWLEALRDAAHAGADIGTATPLSNEATIFTYPRRKADDPPHPVPPAGELARLARIARSSNGGRLVPVPTAHGFCMFIRADCRAAVGDLRADVFAQGYGEENDFCLRATAAGFVHVAVPGVYVAHHGAVSFAAARRDLLARNLESLERLHPGYQARIAAFIARDPLQPARARMDEARFAEAAGGRDAVLLLRHDSGGGTLRMIEARAREIEARGRRAIILHPAEDGLATISADGITYADLGAYLPAGRARLLALLRASRVQRAEIHHLMGHHVASVMALLRALRVPYEVHVHDWWWICAQLTFIDQSNRFCGEAEAARCASCIAARGSANGERITAAALRARSATILQGADAVYVSSRDAHARMQRHFPALRPQILVWEAPVPDTAPPRRRARQGAICIAVPGAIGFEKGFETLLACAQDAAARDLPLRFVVVGFSRDDAALHETGRVFVTGAFAPGEAPARLAAIGADFGFLPSIWPETWCFALSELWQAGLEAAVFDIGAQAERVRARKAGLVLPLALPPAGINDVLLAAGQRLRRARG